VKRPPRIGWVREVSILLPLVTLLLVLVSTVTLLAYRSAIEELRLALPAVAADPSGELAYQAVLVARLTWLVISVNVALTLLVLLYLRHLVTPVETLLRQARGIAAGREEVAGDEIEFLVSTFERAITALALGGDGEPDEREIASLRRALGSSLDSGVLLADHDNHVLAVNAIGAELLGLPPDPPDAPAISDYCARHPELVEIVTTANLAGQAVSRRELEIRQSEGEVSTLGLTAHPLRRDDGTTRGVLVLFVDLTQARQRADEERRASSLAQLGRMSAGLAHEMRNSLAALRGYLTLIERHPDEDSIIDYLGEIRGESDQLHRVVEDFLSFARPEARLETLSLNELAAHVAADPGLGDKKVQVRDALGGPLRVRVDRQLLERALRNLLLNAAQADRESGSSTPLELAVRRGETQLELSIADRGPGLPPDRAEELFEPFATTRADGVGLGLPMAQRILELHGGTLRLEAREGGGTVAVATLPDGIIVP
jgi:signal transduction histidine kinase